MNAPTIQGWWFSAGSVLPNGDGRSVKVGEWLEVEGEIIPCERGLHLSERAIDALQYAPGSSLCWRVEGDGIIVPHGNPVDKHACSRRRALWMNDADPVLRRFGRSCALDVIHLWCAPEVVVRYLTTGDETVREAAKAAARDAWAAAYSAAYSAAREAAKAAARADAWDAAWAAAWAAAPFAAWAAAPFAAWDAQNTHLEAMLIAHHEGTLDLTAPLEIPARKETK